MLFMVGDRGYMFRINNKTGRAVSLLVGPRFRPYLRGVRGWLEEVAAGHRPRRSRWTQDE